MLQKLLIFFAVVKETMCVVLLFLYSSPDCPVTCCVDQAGELRDPRLCLLSVERLKACASTTQLKCSFFFVVCFLSLKELRSYFCEQLAAFLKIYIE